MSKKQEVVKKEASEVAVMTSESWGSTQSFTQNDIVVPKILPLQFMSEKVKEKKGEYGEFRDTLNNEKFAGLGEDFEVIPFHVVKKWIEYDVVTNKSGAKKREYRGIVPITFANDGLPYADPDGAVERDRCVDVYVLIPKQIADGNSFPYVLSFRRTSLKAGNKLITQILRNERMNKPPCAVTMMVSGTSVQNDAGEYVKQDCSVGRPASAEEIQDAFSWYKIVDSGETKLDESDVVESTVKEKTVGDSEQF